MNNQRTVDTQSIYSVASAKGFVPVKTKSAIFKRNNWMYLLVGVVTLLILSLLIAVIVLSKLLSDHKSNFIPKTMLCDNEECLRISASLKESMDESVDPCDDFYEYVCGRWTHKHPIPDTRFANSWFDEGNFRIIRVIRELLQKNLTDKENIPNTVYQAQALYKSCMDVEALYNLGLDPLFSLLDELNLPHIPAALTKNTTNSIQLLVRIKRLLALEIFIGIDVMPDPRYNRQNIIVIGAPEKYNLFIGDKETEKQLHRFREQVYKSENETEESEDDEDDDDEDLIEKTYIHDIIREIISNGTAEYRTCKMAASTSFLYEDEIPDLVEQIYKINKIIYEYADDVDNETFSEIQLDDEDYMFVEDLQLITDEYVKSINSTLEPQIIWKPFIEEIFQDIDPDWIYNNKILVTDLEYLKNIAVLFTETEQEILETFIWWTVIDYAVPFSSEALSRIWTLYVDEVMGSEKRDSRSFQCASMVNNMMSMAVAWLFVDPAFHKEKGLKLHMMMLNIRLAFDVMVVQNNWMDHVTKIATLRKNMKMKYTIGYPEWLFEEGKLDKYYENIKLSEDELLNNIVKLFRGLITRELLSLRTVNNADEIYWASSPTEVNAYHTFQANQITIPIGILRFPFYNLGLEALNYGAIGSILGHELTHGFDNYGRRYDGDGNFREWWANKTISEYIKRSQCFIDHYNSYYIEEADRYIDGELTLGENIADNGGFKEAYYAYKIWESENDKEPLLPGFTNLTHEQLFFLAFAHTWCEANTDLALNYMLLDSHCPAHIRLLGVLKNSKEFSEVWNCSLGSNMNPEMKCNLW